MNKPNVEQMRLYVIDSLCNENPSRDRFSLTVQVMVLSLVELTEWYNGMKTLEMIGL